MCVLWLQLFRVHYMCLHGFESLGNALLRFVFSLEYFCCSNAWQNVSGGYLWDHGSIIFLSLFLNFYSVLYYHNNAHDDQQQVIEISVIDIIPIKHKYVSSNTLYHTIIFNNTSAKPLKTHLSSHAIVGNI